MSHMNNYLQYYDSIQILKLPILSFYLMSILLETNNNIRSAIYKFSDIIQMYRMPFDKLIV